MIIEGASVRGPAPPTRKPKSRPQKLTGAGTRHALQRPKTRKRRGAAPSRGALHDIMYDPLLPPIAEQTGPRVGAGVQMPHIIERQALIEQIGSCRHLAGQFDRPTRRRVSASVRSDPRPPGPGRRRRARAGASERPEDLQGAAEVVSRTQRLQGIWRTTAVDCVGAIVLRGVALMFLICTGADRSTMRILIPEGQ
jgi:hypothetical protein